MVKLKTKEIPPIDIQTKKVEDMKTSEIIDRLDNDLPEERLTELENELINRYPFSYYFKTKFEEIEQQIEKLNKLLRHYHKGNKILIEI